MRQAERMKRLGTEGAFEVLAEVEKLRAQGRDIVSFTVGEPDFDTPGHIKEACIKALHDNETHYTQSAGILPLREAIAAYVERTRGFSVSPDQVVVTPGAKPIIFHTILALVDPGDEVVYPNPGYPIYESVADFVGAKSIPAPLVEEKEFGFDLERLRATVNERTKLIVLNSPQNPTGGVLSKQDLQAVAELALRYDAWVLADEVYSQILFEGEHHSIAAIPEMRERTIILDGFSKTFAMTGWRLGFGVMNERLAQGVARLVTNAESCTATFVQLGGVAALEGPQEPVIAMREEFRRRRELIVDGLNQIEGISCLKPHGAFYVFPNVTEACRRVGVADAKGLQEKLLHEGGVAVLPRTAFGRRNEGETQEYIRLSYATSQQNIREGLRRIKQVIEG